MSTLVSTEEDLGISRSHSENMYEELILLKYAREMFGTVLLDN